VGQEQPAVVTVVALTGDVQVDKETLIESLKPGDVRTMAGCQMKIFELGLRPRRTSTMPNERNTIGRNLVAALEEGETVEEASWPFSRPGWTNCLGLSAS
jgi:hypothetical protein